MSKGREAVHVTDEVHALAKAHCKKHGLKIRDWVSQLVREAITKTPKWGTFG